MDKNGRQEHVLESKAGQKWEGKDREGLGELQIKR
jgi:hypothetical protein